MTNRQFRGGASPKPYAPYDFVIIDGLISLHVSPERDTDACKSVPYQEMASSPTRHTRDRNLRDSTGANRLSQ